MSKPAAAASNKPSQHPHMVDELRLIRQLLDARLPVPTSSNFQEQLLILMERLVVATETIAAQGAPNVATALYGTFTEIPRT